MLLKPIYIYYIYIYIICICKSVLRWGLVDGMLEDADDEAEPRLLTQTKKSMQKA